MNNIRVRKRVMRMDVERRKERSKRRWTDGVNADLRDKGMSGRRQ